MVFSVATHKLIRLKAVPNLLAVILTAVSHESPHLKGLQRNVAASSGSQRRPIIHACTPQLWIGLDKPLLGEMPFLPRLKRGLEVKNNTIPSKLYFYRPFSRKILASDKKSPADWQGFLSLCRY